MKISCIAIEKILNTPGISKEGRTIKYVSTVKKPWYNQCCRLSSVFLVWRGRGEERRGKEVIVQVERAWASPVTPNPKPALPQESSFCGTWHYPSFWHTNSSQSCTWKALQPDWLGAELLGGALYSTSQLFWFWDYRTEKWVGSANAEPEFFEAGFIISGFLALN